MLWFIYFKLLKWKFYTHDVEFGKKGVIIFAPHTSNWDFIIGRIVLSKLRFKPKFLIKSSLFFFPLGFLLRGLGGLPVDRSKKNNLIDQIASIFNSKEKVFIVFTPEGTRSKIGKWKSGFYFAALKSNVPIYLSFADYKEKKAGFLEVFYPTGNVESDMEYIRSKYYGIKGKHPEKSVFPIEEEVNKPS